MGDADPFVSNGTCWYRYRNPLNDNFIPCGNVAFGHVHCCQKSDVCLEHGACYNDGTGTTYLAGCTDLMYLDASCPNKDSHYDQPWAGLIYCEFDHWVACEEEGHPATVRRGDNCTCPSPGSGTIAFTEGVPIPSIAVMPATSGGSLEWFPGHLPTATLTSSGSHSRTTSHASSKVPSTVGALPEPTSTNNDTTNDDSWDGYSTGAKAGIGIGSAIGVILLFGALSALWMIFRRRRNAKNNDQENNVSNVSPDEDNIFSGPDMTVVAAAAAGQPYHQGDKSYGVAEMPTPEASSRPEHPDVTTGQWVSGPGSHGEPTTPFMVASWYDPAQSQNHGLVHSQSQGQGFVHNHNQGHGLVHSQSQGLPISPSQSLSIAHDGANTGLNDSHRPSFQSHQSYNPSVGSGHGHVQGQAQGQQGHQGQQDHQGHMEQQGQEGQQGQPGQQGQQGQQGQPAVNSSQAFASELPG
ncbi:hypothetical protein B0J18DRAFT_419338 [Chaetomium sp. MPI-SDFR-AT-0129]|nr:hypothetical protein B0J18DRAFT_419338 [Chaetomium sp. MPI-SDFR-AT-0129]